MKAGPGVSARPLAAELFPGVWLQIREPRTLVGFFLGSEWGRWDADGGEYLLIQLSKGYGGGPKAWVGLLVGIDRAQQVPGDLRGRS